MDRLKQKDKELLATGKGINLLAPENAYMGGQFTTNENDYVEVLIHDTNENLLETSIADKEDYNIDENNTINLKTGTILRKLGYDRGNFIIKYNFLRNIAGSYETILVDKDNIIYDGEYHIFNGKIKSGTDPENADISVQRIDLFLRDYKYFIHEISQTRKEVRIAPQSIRNEKYLRDFYYAHRTKKIVTADGSDQSSLIFVDGDDAEDGQARNSKTLKFNDGQGQFLKEMVGGSIRFPNAFVTDYIPIPAPTNPTQFNADTEREGDIRARFFLDTINTTGEIYRNGNEFFGEFIELFENNGDGYTPETALTTVNPTTDSAVVWATKNFSFQGRKTGGLGNVTKLGDIHYSKSEGAMDPIYFTYASDVGQRVVLRSNSILPNTEVATDYTWEISGWDRDKAMNAATYAKIYSRTNVDGNYQIITSPDLDGVPVADPVGNINPQQARTVGSENGSIFIFDIFGKHVGVGVKLTISQAFGASTAESTIYLPGCLAFQPT